MHREMSVCLFSPTKLLCSIWIYLFNVDLPFFPLTARVAGQAGIVRYYGLYHVYPTGESIIRTTFNYYGSAAPGRVSRVCTSLSSRLAKSISHHFRPRSFCALPTQKWGAECNDGEGLIGLRDTGDDFEELEDIKCRFLFSQKPPTRGLYPFYENCAVRDIHLKQFHCFDPLLSNNSANSFVTALWDDDPIFRVGLVLPFKQYYGTKMKCCSLPVGYYVDYGTCHYRYTHDQFYTYYDISFYVLQCPDTYVMTGIGALTTPHDEDVHFDWIQCCRYYFEPPSGVDFSVLPDYYPEYKKLQYDVNHKTNNLNVNSALTVAVSG